MMKHFSSAMQNLISGLSSDKKNAILIVNWHRFMGATQAKNSRIEKLTYRKDTKNRDLTILTTASHATELEYDRDNIKTRINDFLGEPYIGRIFIKQGLDNLTPPDKQANISGNDKKTTDSGLKRQEIKLPPMKSTDKSSNQEIKHHLERLAKSLNENPAPTPNPDSDN